MPVVTANPRTGSRPGPFAAHAADLEAISKRGRSRSLTLPAGTDFTSNDYLGIAGARRLALAVSQAVEHGVDIGSGGSRLLRGHHPEHAALEEEAAAFFGAQSALYFGSGYAANVSLFSTLPQRGDLVVHDALIHASTHEGLRLSRASAIAAGHNDPQKIEDAIRSWRRSGASGQAWIAIESLYSMDGDLAPLDDIMAIAERLDAILLVDEAHATGVWGPDGRGLASRFQGRDNLITLHTCGKALGAEGALVCGRAIVRDFLIQRARPFIFSTAPSPLIAAATRESLRILVDEPERRARLLSNIEAAEHALVPFGVQATGSQILPLIVGDDVRTMELASGLQALGLDVRGIRPPTVPSGTSRLRLSITCNVTASDIGRLAEGLRRITR